MTATAGFSGQIGFVSESVWNTAATASKFLPFESESIKNEIVRLEPKSIRGGRFVQSTWKAGQKKVTGDVSLLLPNVTVATLLKHMFGTIATAGSGPYVHTATPGDLTDKSLTIQVGRPDVGGTINPFTYSGCKIANWEINASVGELVMLKLGITGATESLTTSGLYALQTASYSSSWQPFTFAEASLTIGGSAQSAVRSLTLSGNNALDDNRFRLGSATIKQQVGHDMRDYGGVVSADFESLTNYNRFISGSEAALVATFNNGTDSLVISTNVRFDGETPVIASTDFLEQPLPFKIVSATSDAAAITAVLTNTDSSAA